MEEIQAPSWLQAGRAGTLCRAEGEARVPPQCMWEVGAFIPPAAFTSWHSLCR